MAVNNSDEDHEGDSDAERIVYEKFVALNQNLIDCGIHIDELRNLTYRKTRTKSDGGSALLRPHSLFILVTLVAVACVSIVLKIPFVEYIVQSAIGIRCILPNNYFVWEATRPITDCEMCKDVKEVLVFHNITREKFKNYAYSSRPMLMKGAASKWPAMRTFDYHFLRDLYQRIDGAYESVEDECQILTFKTEFKTLEEVFSMPESRVKLEVGEKPWYVGWSNCHPEVLDVLHQYYDKPDFLPEDAEHSRTDYIFIGYQQGAVMHIDYVSRLMWQAQIKGHKTWKLLPPPECDDVCSPVSFRVEPGDIVLLDTRQWYHDTHIDDGEMSLTVSSEYG
ncbi:uncharacterized protein LOC124605642 [Schistocerca americana]|uniref:uncharacterized protein LOC124605642 n=1 Tax=Schistocerca americana TaxID=7009 RepID=UPI001F5033E0|nr:uncharacterized protein LOC124605642 [Schistocerca americana]